MTDRSLGVAAMLGACLIWGATPIYFGALAGVPTGDIIAHRVIWSLVLFLAITAAGGRLGALRAALGRPPTALRIAAGAAAIGANWLLFLAAVFSGHVAQSSLGYYIFPLMAVLVGAVVFGERPGRLQLAAVGLAAAAVMVLAAGVGQVPWLSLGIAATFAVYGAVKKGLDLPPAVSVAAEFVLLAPPALAWLAWRVVAGGAAPMGGDAGTALLLLGTSLVTAVPMMLMSLAARRVELATLGVLQYLNPTLHFLSAVLWFGEPFVAAQVVAFGLIWTAVALYSLAALTRRRSLPVAPARL